MKYLNYILFALPFVFGCSKDAALSSSEAAGKSGSITRFTVHNGYMYALNPNEVLTYSLQNPDKPVLTHRLATDYGLETIVVYDNTIYLGSSTALYILGIDDPAKPVILSQSQRGEEFFGGCDPVVVKDQYAYSTIKIITNICGNVWSRSALLVYDVSDKTAPFVVAEQELNLPNGLGYSGNYLFVCDEGSDRLELFDISQPDSPQRLSDRAIAMTDPVDLIVDGRKMIVSTKTDFQIYDLGQLPEIRKIGQISR